VSKCEIFGLSDFHDFYTIKSLEGDFGVKIIFIYLGFYLGTQNSFRVYTLSVSLRRIFELGPKKNSSWNFRDHLLVSLASFEIFSCFRYFKNYHNF
jgi:hypothetical protein